MVAQAGPVAEVLPNLPQTSRIIFQIMQAIHHGKHMVTMDKSGIHIQLDEPTNVGELGNIFNRMAEPYCAKITVQNSATTPGQIIAYDSKGSVLFRFGHPQAMVAPIFSLLAQTRASD